MQKVISLVVSLAFALVSQAQECAQTYHTDGSIFTICTAAPFEQAIVEYQYSDKSILTFDVAFDVYPNGIYIHGDMPDGTYFTQFLEQGVDEGNNTFYSYDHKGCLYGLYFYPFETK